VVLITEKEEELQRAVIKWCSTFEERGLEVNTGKSKVMQISHMEGQQVMHRQWIGVTLEQIQSMEYLGTVNNDYGRVDEEINNRIKKENQILYHINNTLVRKKELASKTKMQIYSDVYKLTLICGSESWTMLDKHDSRITAADMRFLRAAAGKNKWDRVRNVAIREELKQKPLVQQIKKSYNGTDM
jgi:hypothetical protein